MKEKAVANLPRLHHRQVATKDSLLSHVVSMLIIIYYAITAYYVLNKVM